MLDFLKKKNCSFECATLSEVGLVRKDNQDNFFARPGLYLVCDGMGGGEGGAEASKTVCNAVAAEKLETVPFAERRFRAAEAITLGHLEIQRIAEANNYSQMGTTAVVLLFDDDGGKTAWCGHVGDSRLYRYRAGAFTPLTRDHTVANALGVSGKGATAAFSHVLTRALGVGGATPEIEWRELDVRDGDVYLLCSDGVYDMLEDDVMKSVFAKRMPMKDTAKELERLILAAGAGDNYTVVAVRVRRNW